MKRILLTSLLALFTIPGLLAQDAKLLTGVDGLSSSLVNCVFIDSHNDVWIGTENGLNRYDGLRVEKYMHDTDDPHSVSHNVIRSIAEDASGHIIVGGQRGVQIYDASSDSFSPPVKLEDGSGYTDNANSILVRRNGEIWITGQKLLKLAYDDSGSAFLKGVGLDLFKNRTSSSISETPDGTLWVSSYGGKIFKISNDTDVCEYSVPGQEGPSHRVFCSNNGITLISDDKGALAVYDTGTDSFSDISSPELKNTLILCYCELSDGSILIGTDGNGFFSFDRSTMNISKFDLGGLPFPSSRLKIHSAMTDKYGNIWLGVFQKGVLMIPPTRSIFTYRSVNPIMSDIMESSCVTSIAYDTEGRLWIGTDNDGLYSLSDETGDFTHFPAEDSGIPRTVFSLMEASDGYIWFGSYLSGLWRFDPMKGHATNSSLLTGFNNETHSVYSLKEDSHRRLWVATMGAGLYYLDLNSGRIVVPDHQNSLNKWLNDICIADDTIYVASFNGLYRTEVEGDSFKNVENFLPGNVVYSIAKDHNTVYAGTADGLALLDLSDMSIKTYTTNDGLSDNKISDIIVTDSSAVWISTANGLSSMDKNTRTFTSYVGRDERVNDFSINASVVDPYGNLIFGGVGGMVTVDMERNPDPSQQWTPKIVSFEVPGRKVALTKDLIFNLNPDEKSFTVNFTTREFNAPDRLTFLYSINGEPWISLPTGQNSLSFGHLTQHKYFLDITVADSTTVSEPVHLTVFIKRAWWASIAAFILYILAISAALMGVASMFRRRRNDQKEIERQKECAEANEEKVKFLIDLSHEIRSPMTLILSPLKNLISEDKDAGRQAVYSIMERNVDKVLSIVNQVLDIRKIEKGQMHLSFEPVRIVGYVKAICSLFSFSLERKNQKLSFRYIGAEQTELWVDPDQFDKIIVNLISNAIKYTPDGGNIDVTVETGQECVKIEVRDDGIGITDSERAKVFERFYQADDRNQGTGLGLNIARSLTELHHGTLSVGRNPDGQGTSFIITIPSGNAHLSDAEIKENASDKTEERISGISPVPPLHPQKKAASFQMRKTIIVADDDDDVRQYLSDELSSFYDVIECSNGKDAYIKVLTSKPDLVISDVVMPEMDGYTLCKKMRREHAVCHIPVILLTAKSQEEEQIKGLEYGADAYIVKPFTISLLKTTISGLLSNRDKLKISYAEPKVILEEINNVKLKTPDEKLIERLIRIINKNLDNPELSVQTLSTEAGISRTHLHRKLKEITNQTAGDFILNIRLEKAAEMLSEKKYSIAELSESVGFKTPSSFATAFKAHFGVSPTEYKRKKAD